MMILFVFLKIIDMMYARVCIFLRIHICQYLARRSERMSEQLQSGDTQVRTSSESLFFPPIQVSII